MSNINKMLIDATHAEETRVVVLKNGRVEEFDFESAARKLLRGNIYLAKVTRVEPSLQAAFVDYGGNRHGFLAFNEIHPDYYQIPSADRQALIDEEAAQEAAEEAEVDAHAERLARRRQGGQRRDAAPQNSDLGAQLSVDPGEGAGSPATHENDHVTVDEHDGPEPLEGDDPRSETDESGNRAMAADATGVEQIVSEPLPPVTVGGFDPVHPNDTLGHHEHDGDGHHHDDHQDGPHQSLAHSGHSDDGHEHSHGDVSAPADVMETSGSEDMVEEMPQRPRRRMRSYKIQEVIKRRQIILVQVVKEERGNKGAALTTYLSLAGRYTVLMPNTARGGGISRKITQPGDRKRLKAIANELEVPEGMGLIIRTAGAARTSQEIKRDFEYLLRLWESVRELTLESTAPSLVYEEGNLIKRSIRDLYNKDVEEIVVAGEPAYREAHDFMRMLMPSHAKNVIHHKSSEPLFTRYRMEQQLAAMFSPQVTLKSGGYLVINQTEALVAIDVNSGKSTREYSIEDTAVNTNLEAADEIARQLKLRDLAGLIVIDFIDMEEKRNNRNVERRLKDALRFDRARIQLGRISHFGLMEMSRQRLRTGVLEGSTTQCPHCQGTGIIRSIESVALAVIRGLEDALMSGTRMALVATATPTVALYILNAKRGYITDMEARHGLSITVQGSDKLQGANFTIDKVAAAGPVETPLRKRSSSAVNMEWGFDGEEGDEPLADPTLIETVPYDDEDDEGEAGADRSEQRSETGQGSATSEEGRRRKRRRGRRSRGNDQPRSDANGVEARTGGRGPDGEDGYADAGQGNIIEIATDEDGTDEVGGETADDARGQRPRGPGETDAEGQARRGRRRGRRGGRRGGQGRDGQGRDGQAGERPPLAANDQTDVGDGQMAEVPVYAGDVSGGYDTARSTGHMAPDLDQSRSDEPTLDYAVEAPVTVDAAGAEGRELAHEPSPSNDAVESAPRNRRPRRATEARSEPETVVEIAATSPPMETASAVAVVEAPVVIAAPVVAPAAPEVKPRRVSSGSSEPVLERVVVTPHAGAAAAPADADAAPKPTRKGWWQKKLGLE